MINCYIFGTLSTLNHNRWYELALDQIMIEKEYRKIAYSQALTELGIY